jgi:hypothetical protein
MPTKIRLAKNRRRSGFSAAEPGERTAYIKLNRQTPCPPRSALSVNQECRISFFTHGTLFAFDNGGDHPGYEGLSMKALVFRSSYLPPELPPYDGSHPEYYLPLEHGAVGNNTTWGGTVDAHTALKTGGEYVPGRTNLYLVKVQAYNSWYNRDIQNQETDYVPVGQTSVPGWNLVVDAADTNWGDFVVSAPDQAVVGMTPQAPWAHYYFRFQVNQVNLQPAVDANRDGNFAPNTAAMPYRFWVNDSKENGDVSTAANAVPGSNTPNYALNQINGRSDLINYFPVVLCLSNAFALLPPTNDYEYHLSQADSGVKLVYSSLAPTNATDYLTDLNAYGYGILTTTFVMRSAVVSKRTRCSASRL